MFAYIELFKPRVMSLAVFTGWVGYAMCGQPIEFIHLLIGFCALSLGAGGAGAFNMWYEKDIDKIMSRTVNRPLPSNKVSANVCLLLAIIVSIVAVLLMWRFINTLTAALLLFTIVFYSLVYTVFLKPHTYYNIVIGGLAGAMPPLMGWTMASNSIDLVPCMLVLLIFLWTPPHFWALAIHYAQDYKNANIPMLPNIEPMHVVVKQIKIYTALLLPVSLSVAKLNYYGISYCIFITCLWIWFWRSMIYIYTKPMMFFRNSIIYLFIACLAMLLLLC